MKHGMKVVLGILFMFAFALAIVFSASETSGETLIVAQDGNGHFEKIQEALNAVGEGGTVRVWEGTYQEHIGIHKSVTLIGNGTGESIIDGEMERDVVRISEDHVSIGGFSIMRSGGQAYGGIYVQAAFTTISNISCRDNYYGIRLFRSDNITIANSEFTNNSNGIYLGDSRDCIISSIACYGNNNGIYISGFSTQNNIIMDSVFTTNGWAGIRGGGHRNSFNNNTCSNNMPYGIYLSESKNNTFTHNTIEGNQYGILITSSSLDNSAHFNDIFNNTRYGIHIRTSHAIKAKNNWWGHSSGPMHPEDNPNGKGDNVSNDVRFDPWLDVPSEKYEPQDDTSFISGFDALSAVVIVTISLVFEVVRRRRRD